MKENPYSRYLFLGVLLCVLPILVIFRILILQLNPSEKEYYDETLQIMQKEWKKEIPVRGLILDRNGQQLANNIKTYEVGVDLKIMKNPAAIAEALHRTLGLELIDVEAAIQLGVSKNLVYVVITDFVPQEDIDELISYMDSVKEAGNVEKRTSLRGLVFNDHLKRNYPNKSIGEPNLGYVGWKKEVNDPTGIQGLEGYYNEILAGQSEISAEERNPILVKDQFTSQSATIITTLDISIQAMLEEVVDREVKRNKSKQGTIIVMDPETGEILGMATSYRVDPNKYWEDLGKLPDDLPFNPAISRPYEPGSVQKPITVALALESKYIDKDFKYVDTGILRYAGVDIYNWDGGAYGPQNLLGCLRFSLNVCMGTITSQYVPTDVLYRYLRAFGYGQLTGIDLEGEVQGFLKTPNRGYWHESDRVTNSFGQGFSATPIQMIMSLSALANDGRMMTPHMVKAISRSDATTVITPSEKGIPISPDTAHFVTELLAKSLEVEASNALVMGYRIAGKTGTGQIPMKEGGYHPTLTNASFVGYGPVDDPKFIVYIWFEEPKTDIWGSTIAAPVFSEVVQQLVVLMDLPPDDVRRSLAGN